MTVVKLALYDSAKTKPEAGHELVKVTYRPPVLTAEEKAAGVTKERSPNVCINSPLFSADQIAQVLATPIATALVTKALISERESMLRDLIEAAGLKAGADIDSDLFSFDKVLASLSATATSGRMTKVEYEAWFDSSISDSLFVAIADKLGITEAATDAETAKVTATLAYYKDKLAAMAGGKTAYDKKTCEALLRALEYASDTDVIASRLKERLTAMIKAQDDTAPMFVI